MAEETESSKPKRVRLHRCMDWLQNQNSETKKSQQNKNDIQFIIQTNADRKKFLLSAAEDEGSVPAGVSESTAEPVPVPVKRLRNDNLRMECEWKSCRCHFSDYEQFQKHIQTHISEVIEVVTEDNVEYACLWDVCGHKTQDYQEMIRHINYHSYHAKLLAIGFNGRATLKLARCRKDSSKRNQLQKFSNEHICLWTDCEYKFNSIQTFFDHIKQHITYSEKFLCSWAGCGASFTRKSFLTVHLRVHTGERLIACYHCGMHFANNRKLIDHLERQNVNPNSPFACTVCGTLCATEYLLNEHTRQHVSAYVCALCDMSAPTPASLACHVRYRHLPADLTRLHACARCEYKAVTRSDLTKHMNKTHKMKKLKVEESSDSEDNCQKEDKVTKEYACHLCPEKQTKVFRRGYPLTKHLVKEHGAQWPHGHSRFRYQKSADGMYRLTTTRYEVLEVFKKILDRDHKPKMNLDEKYQYELKEVAEPTETMPRQFEVSFKDIQSERKPEIEILMCDVDEEGNIIKSEIIKNEYNVVDENN